MVPSNLEPRPGRPGPGSLPRDAASDPRTPLAHGARGDARQLTDRVLGTGGGGASRTYTRSIT